MNINQVKSLMESIFGLGILLINILTNSTFASKN